MIYEFVLVFVVVSVAAEVSHEERRCFLVEETVNSNGINRLTLRLKEIYRKITKKVVFDEKFFVKMASDSLVVNILNNWWKSDGLIDGFSSKL